MGLDIKKVKRNKKMLHPLRECLTEPFWEITESKKNNKLNQYHTVSACCRPVYEMFILSGRVGRAPPGQAPRRRAPISPGRRALRFRWSSAPLKVDTGYPINIWWGSVTLFWFFSSQIGIETSVPDPDPPDPYVLAPPGSGSISQRHVSGFGSGSFIIKQK